MLGATICLGGHLALRAAFTDYLASEGGVAEIQKAILIEPANPVYYRKLASVDAPDAWQAIRVAARLDPRDSAVWIESSQIAEARQDFPAAEAALQKATQLDDGFAPRWLLSEYYYRRRDVTHFFPAVRAALETSYDDVTPLFRLCTVLTPDPETALDFLPDRADVMAQYLDYLVNERNRPDLALPVAARLAELAGSSTLYSELYFCHRLLERGEAAEAARIWNRLSARHIINLPPVSATQGLTNGSLHRPFLANGFDWSLNTVSGVFVSPDTGGPLHFRFSGDQPENCDLFGQWVLLSPGRRYRLRTSYETQGLEGDTGITWRLPNRGGKDLLRGSAVLSAGKHTERDFDFVTDPQTQHARLSLRYDRVPGEIRIAGVFSIYSVDLKILE